MVSKGATLGMNRNERLFVGLENVAGSLNIVFAIRFEGTVSKEAARAAVREIVRAHPRLRSLVEPTTFGHRFRILPAGPAVDERVDAAFEVFRGIDIDDDAAIADASARFANEPIVIEEELPIRVRFLPHRERPVLLLSVHHLAGDGRSMFRWIGGIQRALNGESVELVRLDPPGYDAALYARAPGGVLGALGRSFKAALESSPLPGRALRVDRRAAYRFGTIGAVAVRLRTPVPDLLRAARAQGTSLTALLTAALADALRRSGAATGEGFCRARVSIDLRDYFPAQKPTDGNYVSSFYIDFEPKRADENLRAVEQALRAGISRYADGSRLLAGLTSEIGMAIGRRPLGYVISKLAARDAVTSETFQISNLGRTDGFDRGKVKVISIVPVFRCFDLFAIVIGMSDHVMVTLSYPREVISEEAMRSLGRSLDDVVAELAAQPAEAVAVESGTV